MKSVPISYSVSPANSSNLCISYRFASVPKSTYHIACNYFPSLYIDSPAISSHHLYLIAWHPFSYLYIVSPAITYHLCTSYRLLSYPISVYRFDCQQYLSLLSFRLPSGPMSAYRIPCHHCPSLYIVSLAFNYHLYISYCRPSVTHLCISYRLPSVLIPVYRIACHPFPSIISYRLQSIHIYVYLCI